METEIARSDALTEDRVRGLVNSGPDLEDSGLYFNRELSWLAFNDRVLQLAEDPSVPLLERVKFAAIWESNLDEEFMVRVANLQDLVESGATAKAADAMAPADVLEAVRERVLDQRLRAGRTVERDLRPALAEHGIRIITPDQASAEERARARTAVRAPGVPGAHAAGDRARPAVPLHLQPLAVARRRAP